MVVFFSLCPAVHGRNKGQEKAYELGWFMMACFVLENETGVASLGWELWRGFSCYCSARPHGLVTVLLFVKINAKNFPI